MSQRRKLIFSWTLVALWAALIFFMSAHTGSDFDGAGPLAAIKRWLVSLAAPVFGPETDVVNVVAHFTEYLVFGMLLLLALRQTDATRIDGNGSVPAIGAKGEFSVARRRTNPWLLLAVAVVLASLYAVTDEFHQSFVPGRMCDPADWLTDTLGAMLGAAVAAIALRGPGEES